MTAMLVSCSDGGANDTILANDIKTINVVDETATELTLDLGEDISVNTSVTVTPTITGNVTSYTWSAVSGPGNVGFSDTSTELPTNKLRCRWFLYDFFNNCEHNVLC